jgi:hypothetical protein
MGIAFLSQQLGPRWNKPCARFSACEPKGTEISLPTMPSCSRGRKLKAKESPRYQRVAGHL